MIFRARYDGTSRQVFQREVDLGNARFRLSRRRTRRLVAWAVPLLAVAGVALYLEDYVMFGFAVAFDAFAFAWQAAAYGLSGDEEAEKELDASRIYGKKKLIQTAALVALIIGGYILALHLNT